jgi:hypothetical protein
MKVDEMGPACRTYTSMRNAYRILVREPGRKRQLGRCRYRCQDNIEMVLRKVVFVDVDWIHMVQDRDLWCALVNTVIK